MRPQFFLHAVVATVVLACSSAAFADDSYRPYSWVGQKLGFNSKTAWRVSLLEALAFGWEIWPVCPTLT